MLIIFFHHYYLPLLYNHRITCVQQNILNSIQVTRFCGLIYWLRPLCRSACYLTLPTFCRSSAPSCFLSGLLLTKLFCWVCAQYVRSG